MPYFVPACEFSEDGDEHDDVADQNRHDRLTPAHSRADQSGCQHVGRNAVSHGDPQGRKVVRPPGALFRRRGREILVVEPVRVSGSSSSRILKFIKARLHDFFTAEESSLPI